MKINDAVYIGSFPSEGTCPKSNSPEYAFIGRSNVGKSSLLNMICERKDLARVSKKPGRTQHLNYYHIDKSWYIVDLPGYGYAKISKKKRKEWEQMIYAFLQKRQTLQCTFVLVDANIPPQKLDVEFMGWLGEMRIPFVIVYTKVDRLHRDKIAKNIEVIQEELLKYWTELPPQFLTSSREGTGRQEILNFMAEVNERVTQS